MDLHHFTIQLAFKGTGVSLIATSFRQALDEINEQREKVRGALQINFPIVICYLWFPQIRTAQSIPGSSIPSTDIWSDDSVLCELVHVHHSSVLPRRGDWRHHGHQLRLNHGTDWSQTQRYCGNYLPDTVQLGTSDTSPVRLLPPRLEYFSTGPVSSICSAPELLFLVT